MPAVSRIAFFFVLVCSFIAASAQDSIVFQWTVTSKQISPGIYELEFSTPGANGWQLYIPNQQPGGVATTEVRFNDSSIQSGNAFAVNGKIDSFKSELFGGELVRVQQANAQWKQTIKISGDVPAILQGTLFYTYGRADEFYPSSEHNFSVPMEGGVQSSARIKIDAIDVNNPVAPCGDEDTSDKSLMGLFLIGTGAGLLALLFPCIFPLIPLTVSYFTKKSQSKKKGIVNALLYGFSIFLIYAALSLPFHLFNVRPEILNNISTNVPLNIAFFIVFIVFAISFFGYFEISLPSNFANKLDSRSGINDLWGIFFMALTLAVVSFSCTSGILGALLVGAFSSEGGAWQLTAGMAGFGFGLGLPFVLFALFPNWLQSLPKSGGWMNELKVVFGFIEVAMAIKFLSNADLVKQWGFLKREVFLLLWVLVGLGIILYLAGVIRFTETTKPKFTKTRWAFIGLFALITIYLLPGLTNTRAGNLHLISGFPPPLCYSVYDVPVNCERNIQPIHNDYEGALKISREQNKPLLIDFTGWACVNCRRMEENVWTDPEVARLMRDEFIVVSLYVDERKKLPVAQQTEYVSKNGDKRPIITVGDKWATFQSENFYAVSQPQYAILNGDEKALTRTKAYTPDADEFREWLICGLDAFKKSKK